MWRSYWSGGLVAKELHRVAALDGALPFAGEPLEFDGADFRAVLFLLPALLRLLVGVEVAFDPVDRAVEEIDRGPEEVVEVGLEARLRQRRDEGVENVGDRSGGGAGFRQGPRVGFVGEGAIAEELQFAEKMGGGGRGPRGLEVRFGSREGHVGSPFVMDRAFRGLHRRDKRAGEPGWHPEPQAKGRSVAEDGGGRLFCLAMERRAIRALARVRRRKIVGQSHCPPGLLAA